MAQPDITDKVNAPHVITRRAVAGWVLYDLANTIFSMGVISLNFPLWVRDCVGENRADAVMGNIMGISMFLIFIVSPLLGAMTDKARRRMPFLVGSTLFCMVTTCLLARWGFYATAVLFIVANVCYQAGQQFYDALLPEVSTENNRGRIGGIGVGIGYLGSYIAIGLSLYLAHVYKGRDPAENSALLFLLYGIAYLLFAVPCFLFVKERGNPRPRPINLRMVWDSTRVTIRTLISGKQYPGLVRFLIGRVFYTDAINTVISFMALFTVNVAVHSGLNETQGKARANLILLSAISFAVLGGFIWGFVTDKLGPKRTLNVVLWCWMGIFLFAACIGLFALPLGLMYVLAAMAGFCLGGVWASDRPYMLRLTPPSRIGEFYGLYCMVGRFSAISGPVLWGAITALAIRLNLTALAGQGVAVLMLLAMVVVGYLILRPVSDKPRDWSALAPGEVVP